MTLTEVHRRWLRRLGIPLGAIVTFVFALHLTFPYDRLELTARDALSEYWEVVDLEIGPGWLPGHVKISGLTLRTRPAREGEKPLELTVDEADVSIGLFAALTGGLSVDVDATLGGGEIEASFVARSSGTTIEIEATEVPIGALPGVKDATGGVPLEGALDLAFTVELPKGKWREADGELTFACEGCTIGDGVAKIRPSAPGQKNAFSEEGLTLPKLKLGKLEGTLAIKKGLGKLEKFDAKSPDGELYLEGEIKFDDPFKRSNLTAYLRFKASDALKQREARIADMELMMGGAGRRSDGTIGVKIGPGAVTALKYVTTKTNPLEGKAAGDKDKTGRAAKLARPNGNVLPVNTGAAAMEEPSSPPLGEGVPNTTLPPATTAAPPPPGHEPPPPDARAGSAQGSSGGGAIPIPAEAIPQGTMAPQEPTMVEPAAPPPPPPEDRHEEPPPPPPPAE